MSSICQCCGLCRKSRHETYVDDVFPSVDEPTPVEAEMGKLVYYARTSPNNLNRVAGYLLVKLRRFTQRARYNQVEVAVSVMLRLLSDCPPQQVPHLADALLSMVHTLLEQRDTRLQVLACNTFASFCAVKEVTPLYQSVHYEFFVDRFSGLSLIARQDNVETYYNTRMAGLKGLEGMLTKAASSTGLQQYNIWETHCMKKIVPALLLNMQMTEAEKSEVVSDDLRVGQLAVFSENLLKELVSSAGLGHIDAVLHPVLVHLDVNKCWMEQRPFAHHVFMIIMDSIQVQFRYKAVQALISHLDKGNPNIDNPSAKRGILDTVSQCIGVGSEGFLGPSAMDAFTKLLKHLKKSIDNCSIKAANVEVMRQANPLEYELQLAIITTIGNTSKVLPDYEKSHVMSLIISHIPEHSTDDTRDAKLVMVAYQLLQCLKEVTFCYTTVNWTKTFPETLFTSFRKLFTTKGTILQVNILEIWLYLLDNHNNRTKIPLNVSWASLEEVKLQYGTEGSTRFMKQSGAEMFKMMMQYSKLLPVGKEVMSLYYKVMAVTVLECGKNKLKDCLQLVMKLQEVAVKETFLEQRVRVGLHCMTGGLLHLLGFISGLPKLQEHVKSVIRARNEKTPHFVIDNFFGTDSPDTSIAPSPLSPSEGLDDELLFDLEQAELQDLEYSSPSPIAGNRSSFHSILMKHRRGSDSESTHSLDYKLTESPADTEQITYSDIVADINSAQESSIPIRSPASSMMEYSASISSRHLDINKLIAGDSSESSSVGKRTITPKSAFEVNLPDF